MNNAVSASPAATLPSAVAAASSARSVVVPIATMRAPRERAAAIAFAGLEPVRALYAHAIRERYRFFSYGDAMLLERGRRPEPHPGQARGGAPRVTFETSQPSSAVG